MWNPRAYDVHEHVNLFGFLAVEDKTSPNQVVLVLLGVSVLTLIIIMVIIVIRIFRQPKTTTGK